MDRPARSSPRRSCNCYWRLLGYSAPACSLPSLGFGIVVARPNEELKLAASPSSLVGFTNECAAA